MHPSAQRVDSTLRALGLRDRVRELPGSTRTASDAARALSCEVRQIVKSIVFRTTGTSRPILVLASGDHRVDEKWMERYVGEPLGPADPEFARSVTGFAVGGVPPLGHAHPLTTFVDYRLLGQSEVWAAAGTPHAVCRLTSRELLEATGGRAVPVVPVPEGRAPQGRWVTFDCYGTLVDWRTGLRSALERIAPGLMVGDFDRFFRRYLTEERRIEAGTYQSYRATMAEALRTVARQDGSDLDSARAEAVADSLPQWPLFPDTAGALRTLRDRGVHLAVLSNIDRALLEQTLSHHGLIMDLSVTAEEVRSYKPAPPHWIHFLERTGADPEAVWHVAGSFEHDIATADRLGFRTAFVHRYGEPADGRGSSVTVPNLDEFVARFAFPPETLPLHRPDERSPARHSVRTSSPESPR